MQNSYTPFHAGELAVQDQFGVREAVQSYAPRMIRRFMPDQHREFYTALPYFFMASVDNDGLVKYDNEISDIKVEVDRSMQEWKDKRGFD